MDDLKYTPPEIHSPSSLNTYVQCPQRWYFEKIAKLPRKPSGEAALNGTFVHAVMEKVMELPPERRNLTSAKSIASELWAEYPSMEKDFSKLELDTKGSLAFKKKSWKGIAGAFSMENLQDVEVHGLEQRLNGHVGSVKLRGIADLVVADGDSIIVVDYKGGSFPFKKEWQGKYILQIGIYCALIEELGLDVIGGELWYVTHRKKIKLEWDSAARTRIISEVEDIWANILDDCRSGEFEAITGPLCGYCDFTAVCPAWDNYEI